ncbi:hypothetical protein TNCT_470851 [Trichonephila clavata]|uniref:Uncharacterized protein n=1 Tax=Trichonephila clavata TaxID=2740835 RepID=A0A8X6GGR7_TRICU|nr:hypothetical protein TNCT_470851 [Trichonephila clavata]
MKVFLLLMKLCQGSKVKKFNRKPEKLCSTPLTTAPQISKSKRKPNASVKTAEVANARRIAMEKEDYEQIAQIRKEEHTASMKKRTLFKDEGLKGKTRPL